MKTHTKVLLIIIAVVCLIPASVELFKVMKDFNGETKVFENKTDESPHEQLRDLLEKNFTNKYIKLSPVVDYNEYPKSTLEVDLEKKLQKLMQPYLKKINETLHQNYYVMDYENVIVQTDTNGNKQYLVDVFVHDKDLHIVQKIIFDIVVYIDDRIWLNKIVHSNAKQPLEHVDNYKSTHGVTTNQIISDSNIEKPKHVEGNPDINLDYSKVDFKDGLEKKRLSVDDLNDWILPEKMQELTDEGVQSWPCGNTSDKWDKWGVLKNKQPKMPCQGYNQGATARPVQPYDNPTVGERPHNSGDYHSYFALDTAIPSFP